MPALSTQKCSCPAVGGDGCNIGQENCPFCASSWSLNAIVGTDYNHVLMLSWWILCVNSAASWCPVVWLNTSLDVAEKMCFLRCDCHWNQETLSETCGWVLSNQLKASRERRRSLKEKAVLPLACLWFWAAAQTLTGIPNLLASPVDVRLASFHDHMSQFLKISQSVHILLVWSLGRTLTNQTWVI